MASLGALLITWWRIWHSCQASWCQSSCSAVEAGTKLLPGDVQHSPDDKEHRGSEEEHERQHIPAAII